MRKIINGKQYDTDTAKKIGEYFNGESGINYFLEVLYQKRTGEFFIFGSGGANTKYSEQTGNNTWAGTEKIIPCSWEAAKDWTEKYLSADKYEELFGEVVEDHNKIQTTIVIATDKDAKARRAAAQQGITYSAYIESLIP